MFETDKPVAVWETGNVNEYIEIEKAYESMFDQYGDTFETFSWEYVYEGEKVPGYARLEESHSTGNGETVVQIWTIENDGGALEKTESATRMRITAVRNDGTNRTDQSGKQGDTFEYQFQYKKGTNPEYPE